MSLEKAINKTISYAHNFGSQINEKEILERLISNKIYPETEITKLLKKTKLTNKINPWRKDKLDKAIKLGIFLKKYFKDILFLGVSGSVASGHPKKDDDIDIVIITKNNKLWLTRFKLRIIVFLKKIPHRRYGQIERKNDFCFNLWLDEKGLSLPIKKQTLQSATDLIMLIPIFNKNKVYEMLVLDNDWVKKYLATGYTRLSVGQSVRLSEKEDNNFLDILINKLFFWPQYWYMKKKITSEEISYHQAFFYK